MSLLLYAITDAPDVRPDLRGAGGVPIEAVRASGLIALTSQHVTVPELDEETIWSFDHVIESVMEQGAVLPVRFGTTLATTDEVATMLARGSEGFADKLERVRGAVELSVNGIWPDASQPVAANAAITGTDYMQDRLAPQRRAHDLAAQIHAQLDARARASRHRVLTRPSVAVSAAFLVDRGSEGEFVNAVTRLDAQLEDAELVCTGPWPAYSFVTDAPDD